MCRQTVIQVTSIVAEPPYTPEYLLPFRCTEKAHQLHGGPSFFVQHQNRLRRKPGPQSSKLC
jgi:hypothetical protein